MKSTILKYTGMFLHVQIDLCLQIVMCGRIVMDLCGQILRTDILFS